MRPTFTRPSNPARFDSARQWWQRWWQIAIALVLVFGIVTRCINVGHKVYWHDEVFTSIRVLGYSQTDIERMALTGEPVRAEDLLQLQQLAPDKTLSDTVSALVSHPEHPPLYYLLLRGWVAITGDAVAAFRSLSVLFSLLAFPLMYWLCWELFQSVQAGWVAIALLAVSPIHLLYAQEAREYSLWVVTILLASISLIRAVQRPNWRNWSLYALALAIGFYTTLLTGGVAIAHGLFILITQRWPQWRNFLLAGTGAILLFSPWLVVMQMQSRDLQRVTQWTQIPAPLSFLSKIWGLHFSSVWFDVGLPLDHPLNHIVIPLALALLISGLYLTWRHANQSATWFLITLAIIPALCLILPDVIRGGRVSSMTRYFFPSLLAVQIAFAFSLSCLLHAKAQIRRRIGQTILAGLIAVGIVSDVAIARSPTWWSKVVSYQNAGIANVVNQAENPLILIPKAGTAVGNAISLSHQLNPNASILLFDAAVLPDLPADAAIFLAHQDNGTVFTTFDANDIQLKLVEAPGVYELWQVHR